ncbi:MAG: outer membrane protein transport protein [SAR324 cluster bacterium]|nr:outer membrane protein transport protein [SAR324 cluster bacterium]
MRWKLAGIGLWISSLFVPTAWGAGFYTPLFSADQFAQSNAVMTMPSHADTAAFNPAGMMRLLPGKYISAGGALASLSIKWEGTRSNDGERIDGPSRSEESLPGLIPAPTFQYANVKEKTALGFSFLPRFASSIAWDKNWVGDGLVEYIDLYVVGFNASYAKQILSTSMGNHSVAIGGTLYVALMDYQREGPSLDLNNEYVKDSLKDYVNGLTKGLTSTLLSEETLDNIFDTIGTTLGGTIGKTKMSEKVRVEGAGTTSNYNLAYLGNIGPIYLAANYHSSVPLKLRGKIGFFVPPMATTMLFLLSTIGGPLVDLSLQQESAATINATLPWHLETAIGWKDDDLNPTVEVELGYAKMGYSVTDKFAVQMSKDSTALPLVGYEKDLVVLPLNFIDTQSYRAGANYHWENFIFRGGAEISSSLNQKNSLGPIVPLGGVTSLSGGVEYKLNEQTSVSGAAAVWIFQEIETNDTIQQPIYEDPFTGKYSGGAVFGLATVHHQF